MPISLGIRASGTGKVLDFFGEIKKKYDLIANRSLYQKELDDKIAVLAPGLKRAALELTEKRKKAGAMLKKTIESELGDLGIRDAEFQCRIEPQDFSAAGSDRL